MIRPIGATRTAQVAISISLAISLACGFSFGALALGQPRHPRVVLVAALVGMGVAVTGFVIAAIADWRGAWSKPPSNDR